MKDSAVKIVFVLSAVFFWLCYAGVAELSGNDAITEIQKLLAPDGEDHDHFGAHVAMAKDVIVVAAVGYADPQGPFWGNVYVFRQDSIKGEWKREETLTPPSGDPNDRFGSYVATDGEVIVVGAPFADHSGRDSGAVYVYRYDELSMQWTWEDTLIPQGLGELDYYGDMLAIDGDVIVVGHRSNDDLAYNAGAAYVFRYQSGSWIEEQKLFASDGYMEDYFGWGVSKFGDTILVGAYYDDSPLTDAGSVYVFQYNPGGPIDLWIQTDKIVPDDVGPNDRFGTSVSLYGDWALIGTPLHESSPGVEYGAVYVYQWDNLEEKFKKHQKIIPDDAQDGDYFGWRIAVHGEKAVVNAHYSDHQGPQSGAGYLILYDDLQDEWYTDRNLLAADGKTYDYAGAVAIYENTAIMGTARNDNEKGLDAGAAYVYELDYDFTLSLFPTVVPADGFCTFTTKGAQSYTDTWLVYGVKGLAYTYYQPLGVMLRLKSPKSAHGPYYTNINGQVEWTLAIPSLPPTPVWFQVIQPGQASNAVATKIE